jgi:predicted Zn-dependent protease
MRFGLVLVSCLVALAAPPQTDQLEQARRLAAAGRTEEAMAIYEALVQSAPDNAVLRMNLAVLRFKAGRYEQVIEDCRTALQRDPRLATAWLFLGASQLRLGRPKEAVEPLRRALAAQPGDRNARLMLAESLLAVGEFAEAAAHFEQLVSTLADNPRLWYGLERAYQALAHETLAQLEATAPASPYLAALKGQSLLEGRQYGLALRQLRQALATLPELPGLHAALAELYRRTGHADWAAIEEERERSLPQHPCSEPANKPCPQAAADSPEGLYWKIQRLRSLAAQAYAKLEALPESAALHELRARKLDGAGRAVDAAAEWEKALALAPGDRVLEKGLALSLLSSRNFGAALTLIERLRAREPDSAEILFLCGSCRLGLEQPEEALECLEGAVKRDPGFLPARGALGQAYLTLGRFEQAIPHLEAALAADEDGTRHFQLAQAWRGAGRPERAEPYLRRYRELRQAAEARRRRIELAEAITAP